MQHKPEAVLKAMLENDHFTRWMGLEVDEHREGYCKLHFVVKKEMLNGFGIIHGGAVFAAADSAFAFACNAQNNLSVALDVHISFMKAAREGEVVSVEAKQVSTGNKVGFYDVAVVNEKGEMVATFRGTAYKTGKLVMSE